MGKAYSVDLRERIVSYIARGHSARAAAAVFGVSASTAIRLATGHRAGVGLAPKPQGRAPGTAGKLADHKDFLIARVRAQPDITLQELADALRTARGVEVQFSSLHRALGRAGCSYKKGLIAAERERPEVARDRRLWITRRQPRMRGEPHRLVFIDETAVMTNLTRLRGRSPVARDFTAWHPSADGARKPSSPT